jgi:U2 small nuclear ribonucleoprotein B''
MPYKERKNAEYASLRAAQDSETKKRAAPTDAAPTAATNAIRPIKSLKSTSKQAVIPSEYLPPNKLIMVENVPTEFDKDALIPLFQQFEGFMDVRIVTVGKFKGLVFVEFSNIAGATSAKEALGGSRLGDKVLKITYSKEG